MIRLFTLFLVFSVNLAIAGLGQSVINEREEYKIKFVKFLLDKLNNTSIPRDDSSAKLVPENVSKHKGLFHCSDIAKNKLYKFNSIKGNVPSYFLFTNVKDVPDVRYVGNATETDPLLGQKFDTSEIPSDENESDDEKFNKIITEINTNYDINFSSVKSILKKRYLHTPKGTKLSQISKDNILDLKRRAGAYSVVDSELEFRQAVIDNTEREAVFQDTYSFIEYNKDFYNLFACEEFTNTMHYFNVVLWGFHLNKGVPLYTPFFIFSTEYDKTQSENSLFVTDKDDFFLKFNYWFKYKEFFEFTTILLIEQWSDIIRSGASFDEADLTMNTNPILSYRPSNYDYEKNRFLTYVVENFNHHKIQLKQHVTLKGNDSHEHVNKSIHDTGASVNAVMEDKIEQASDTNSKFSVKHDNSELIGVSYYPLHTPTSIECRDFQMNVLYLFEKEKGKGWNYFLFTPELYVNVKKLATLHNVVTYRDYQYSKFDHNFGTNKYYESTLDYNTFMAKTVKEIGVYHTIDDKYFQVFSKSKILLELKKKREQLENNKIYKDSVYISLFKNYISYTAQSSALNIEKLMEGGINPIQNFNFDDKDYFNKVVSGSQDINEIFRNSIIGLNIFYYTYSFIRYNGIDYNLVACDELEKENNHELILWGYQVVDNPYYYKPFYVILVPSDKENEYKLSLTDKLEDPGNNPDGIFKSNIHVSHR